MSDAGKRTSPVVFVNGKKVPAAHALVSLFKENCVTVFESIKSCGGALFQPEAHLNRLFESAKTLGFKMPKTRSELTRELKTCVKQFKNEDKFVRLMLDDRDSYIFITDRKRPQQIYEEGVDLTTLVTRRNLVHSIPPEVKSNAFVNNVLATIDFIKPDHHPERSQQTTKGLREGSRTGSFGRPSDSLRMTASQAFDGVFLGANGYVVEATTWNIFAVKDGKLLTPESGFLHGVTRQVVIKCASLEHIPVLELRLTRHDFWNADEAFLTNTSGEILPIRSLDARKIGDTIPGPVTKKLQRRFRKERDQELKRV